MRIVTLVLVLSPINAVAEGAIERFSCAISTICDAAGMCRPSNQTIEFELTPIDVKRHGEGEYLLRYNEIETQMSWLTQYGPWVWSETDVDLQTIVFSGPTTLVWVKDFHSQSELLSETKFLNCETAQ